MADKNESGIFKVAMNLILTCLVSGCIIGVVFFITGPIATAKAEQMKQDSIRPSFPMLTNSFLYRAKKIRLLLKKAARKSLTSFRRLRKDTAVRLSF